MSKDSEFFNHLADLMGTPPLGEDERVAVLDLTRVVAHGSERRYAPLTAYALALLLSPEDDAGARTEKVRQATLTLQAQTADAWAAADTEDPSHGDSGADRA